MYFVEEVFVVKLYMYDNILSIILSYIYLQYFVRFGYVDVKPEDLDKALELSSKELNNEPITIEKSKPRTQDQQGGRVQGGQLKDLVIFGGWL